MDKLEDLSKGEFMEEQLRAYFLSLGYYVVRGAKFKFHGVEVTDIDLWLYQRSTPISRERINVDIKNKSKPAAIERIIVAKGIMEILGFDRCIIATTDKREEVIEFGEHHGVRVLNGNFLNRIKGIENHRIPEEIFNTLLKDEFTKFTTNWFLKYENSKSKLIGNLDFATANDVLGDIRLLLEQIPANPQQREILSRMLYLIISHLFIIVDFLLKDMAFIEVALKLKQLEDGFRYGAIGNTKIRLRIEQIANETRRSINDVKKLVESLPVDILRDFFGKNDTAKNLFLWAREFENFAYQKEFIQPYGLPTELKAAIGVLCDCSGVDRKHIMNPY